jgi:hypothetical protein
MNILLTMGIALAISIAGNLWLFNSRDTALKRVGEITVARNVADETAQICNRSVAQLEADAKAAKAASEQAVAAARDTAKGKQATGLATLSKPRSNPSNDCASIETLTNEWFATRVKK